VVAGVGHEELSRRRDGEAARAEEASVVLGPRLAGPREPYDAVVPGVRDDHRVGGGASRSVRVGMAAVAVGA